MSIVHSPEAVFNQPPSLEDYNLFDSDCALREAVNREGGGWISAEARKLGQVLGKPETINLGVLANRFTPELRTHDRFGYRIDEVVYHPAYHELMRIGIAAQTHSLPWIEKRPGAHVARCISDASAPDRRRYQLSVDNDIRCDPVAPPAARTRNRMGTAGPFFCVRPSIDAGLCKGWRPFRDGDDRTPGRQRRTSQHNFG